MKDLILDLCKRGGISGDENSVASYCENFLKKYTDDVTVDFNNNVIAVLGGEEADYTFLLDAHLDKIGFIVTEINENGFLKIEGVGGVDLRTLLDSPVTVYGKEKLSGVICCMPPHLSDGKEDKAVSSDKLWVDLGLPYEKVIDLVKHGDSVSFYASPKELINNRILSPALDNRSGVAALLSTTEKLASKKLNSRVIILLSSQEETYAAGAKTAPYNYEIDECICVDVSFASQPAVGSPYSAIKLGGGPMICISPNLNRDMFKKLKETAENNKIKYQLEVCNGKTGTNADHITLTKSGVKTALVSIPEKNMHTQSEIIDINDVNYLSELLSTYILNGGVR